MKSLKRDLS